MADLPQGRARRAARVAGATARVASSTAAGAMSRDREAALERHAAAADRLVDTLGSMKGAAMKLGQLASFVELDFLPPAYREIYRERLARLRSEARAVEWRELERVLREEWGERPSAVLADIDPEPAASASVGQVHRGRLRDGGEVAVKVQYPGVEEAIRADLGNASLLVQLARALAPGLDARAIVAELRDATLAELDFELEAQAQRAFARAYRGHPFVRVPAVETGLSRTRVLVCEWVEGRPFDDVRRARQDERNRLAEIIFRFYYGSIFRLGHYNADPHPGNYLLAADGAVAFLDFGATRRIARERALRLGELTLAAAAGDAPQAHRLLVDLGYLVRPEALSGERAIEGLRATSGWLLEDGPVRMDAALVRSALAASADPRGGYRDVIRAGTLPAEDLMLQRLSASVVSVLAQLEAEANWLAIARELWELGPPASELGRLEAGFWEGRGG